MAWSGDAAMLPISIASVRAAHPLIPCAVIEDAEHPLPGDTKQTLQDDGVYLMQSKVPRNGNLNGLAWTREQLRCLDVCAENLGMDNLIKIDSDVVCRTLQRLTESLATDGIHNAGIYDEREERAPYCYGPVYGLSVTAVRACLDALKELPPWAFDANIILPRGAPEDHLTGRLIGHRLGTDCRAMWRYEASGGLLAGWQYRADRQGLQEIHWIREYWRRFECVTFGNRHLIPSHKHARREVVRVMSLAAAQISPADRSEM